MAAPWMTGEVELELLAPPFPLVVEAVEPGPDQHQRARLGHRREPVRRARFRVEQVVVAERRRQRAAEEERDRLARIPVVA